MAVVKRARGASGGPEAGTGDAPSRDPSRGGRSPWLPMLGPPLAWTAAFLSAYAFARLGCLFDFATTRVAGVTLVRGGTFVLIGVAVVFSLYTGWISYRWWQDLDPDASPREVEPFTALFGMLLAVLFAAGLGFLALTIPFAAPCLP